MADALLLSPRASTSSSDSAACRCMTTGLDEGSKLRAGGRADLELSRQGAACTGNSILHAYYGFQNEAEVHCKSSVQHQHV